MTGPQASSGTSVSLERGLSILSAFSGARPVLGIADIARAVGLTKSTTHRYIATLVKLDYVMQDPETKKYHLGPRVVARGWSGGARPLVRVSHLMCTIPAPKRCGAQLVAQLLVNLIRLGEDPTVRLIKPAKEPLCTSSTTSTAACSRTTRCAS